MDKTKSKLAAFFENDEEESSFPQKAVDDAKLSQYTAGKVRKSRREKEQEAAEAKKREEEVDAAKAYAEFLDAFEGDEAGKKKATNPFVKAGEAPKTSAAMSSFEHPSSSFRGFNRTPSPPASSAPKPKGKRAMDAFLEEIKREQAEREAKYSRHAHGHGRSVTAMAAYEGQSGSKDRGDPQTSNVFVANLPTHVTEQSLGNFFARMGPVGSVKIMWPRTDVATGPSPDINAARRAKAAGLSGFVSFMKRKDAESALRELDGFDWGGFVLRVGWSKAVPIAAKPKYVSDVAKPSHEDRSRSHSRGPDRRRSRSRDRFRTSRRSLSLSRSRSPRPSYSRSRKYEDSRSRSPRRRYSRSPISRSHTEEEEAVTDTFIRAVAAEVRGHDAKYEETLRERERNNPKYAFLLHRNHRRHAFYRGLVESERQLDPEFDDEGYNSVYSTDSAEESEREHTHKNILGKLARKRFEAMLRALSGKRGEIAKCMTFSLEHAEAAHEVADIIVSSLLVDGTAVPRKVARLHLICDILHNSAASVPSAWKFRQEFQSRLGIVFDHLANIYHSFPGRITAETFKKQITTVVDIWEDWIVFPPDFTAELRQRLEGAAVAPEEEKPLEKAESHSDTAEKHASRFKASSFQPATEAVVNAHNSSDGEPMDVSDAEDEGIKVDGEPIDDVDGVPVDDVDGVPIDDVDGVLVDDVDGMPVDDVDGIPIDDMDGVPIDDVDGDPVDDIDGAPTLV
ncbi:hypothetical protein BDQ12DRAFT_672925 [Crucibulum laeve]|uniref:CID domain-containing protein n=1 Tax=Crucibulum laeve TaxID=68775 RepID=A0A5C3MIB2_9AGAR|nr:hypothetical protein BDQ12DRAFT_672925 [Crucibulum laeve]